MLYGLEIDAQNIKLIAYQTDSQTYEKVVPTPAMCYHAFNSAIKQLVEHSDKTLHTRGTVSIHIPGQFDPTTKQSFCSEIPCIHNKDLLADLEFILNRPVIILGA